MSATLTFPAVLALPPPSAAALAASVRATGRKAESRSRFTICSFAVRRGVRAAGPCMRCVYLLDHLLAVGDAERRGLRAPARGDGGDDQDCEREQVRERLEQLERHGRVAAAARGLD